MQTSVWLCGHSAGAHLASLLVLHLRHHLEGLHTRETCGSRDWLDAFEPRDMEAVLGTLRLVVGLGGVYDIGSHFLHEAWRGVEHISGMARAMHGEEQWHHYSPTASARRLSVSAIATSVRQPVIL